MTFSNLLPAQGRVIVTLSQAHLGVLLLAVAVVVRLPFARVLRPGHANLGFRVHSMPCLLLGQQLLLTILRCPLGITYLLLAAHWHNFHEMVFLHQVTKS